MARIPVGTHEARVIATAIGRTGTGKEQIAVTFEDEAGNQSTWYGYFTEASLERTMKTLTEALGWDAAADDHRIDALHNSDTLVGHRAQLVVEDEEYQNKVTAKIKWVNSLGGGAPLKEQMNDMEAKDFASNLRKRLLAKGGAKPSTRSAPARQAARVGSAKNADGGDTPADDDDLPLGGV